MKPTAIGVSKIELPPAEAVVNLAGLPAADSSFPVSLVQVRNFDAEMIKAVAALHRFAWDVM